MKIVLISDTHNQHEKIKLPEGDMIIHAGDITGMGSYSEVMSFLQWYSRLKFKYKIFIAGNHDFLFEKMELSYALPEGVTYLQDSLVEIEGLQIYGSPYTPKFFDWAFMKNRGEDIQKVWELIPEKLDILITHGPPLNILDKVANGANEGCENLLKKVNEVNPRVHVFGHIHEGYGSSEISGTRFFNASVLNENYRVTNSPLVIEIE
jgi:Icc-related predicted phosphoesterase